MPSHINTSLPLSQAVRRLFPPKYDAFSLISIWNPSLIQPWTTVPLWYMGDAIRCLPISRHLRPFPILSEGFLIHFGMETSPSQPPIRPPHLPTHPDYYNIVNAKGNLYVSFLIKVWVPYVDTVILILYLFLFISSLIPLYLPIIVMGWGFYEAGKGCKNKNCLQIYKISICWEGTRISLLVLHIYQILNRMGCTWLMYRTKKATYKQTSTTCTILYII